MSIKIDHSQADSNLIQFIETLGRFDPTTLSPSKPSVVVLLVHRPAGSAGDLSTHFSVEETSSRITVYLLDMPEEDENWHSCGSE